MELYFGLSRRFTLDQSIITVLLFFWILGAHERQIKLETNKLSTTY